MLDSEENGLPFSQIEIWAVEKFHEVEKCFYDFYAYQNMKAGGTLNSEIISDDDGYVPGFSVSKSSSEDGDSEEDFDGKSTPAKGNVTPTTKENPSQKRKGPKDESISDLESPKETIKQRTDEEGPFPQIETASALSFQQQKTVHTASSQIPATIT